MKVGNKFYDTYGHKNHIVNTFMDDDDEIIVYRTWLKHKKTWRWEAKPKVLLEMGFTYGGYKWI